MHTVKPTVLVGADKYGAKVVGDIYDSCLRNEHSILKDVIRIATVIQGGKLSLSDEVIEFHGIPDEYNSLEKDFFVKIKESINPNRERILYLIENLFREIQSIDVNNTLTKNNYQRNESQIIIIGSSFDPLGSSLILELLTRLNKIPLNFSISLILFLPGLSDTELLDIRKIEQSRSFAFLSEIDFNLAKVKNLNAIYLLNNENEKGATLPGFDHMVAIVRRFIYLLIYDKLYTTTDMSDIIGLPVLGSNKNAYYSSFGLSCLRYSRTLLEELLIGKSEAFLLEKVNISKDDERIQISKNLIGSDVREFLLRHHLLKFTDFLMRGDDGASNFHPFNLSNYGDNPHEDIDQFFLIYDRSYENYEKEDFTTVIKNIESSSDKLTEHCHKLLHNKIEQSFENENLKAHPYLISFFSYLIQKDSKFLNSEELTLDILNLNSVFSIVSAFYEDKLGIKSERRKLNDLNVSIKNKEDFIEVLKEKGVENSEEELNNQQIQLDKLKRDQAILEKEIKKNENNILDPSFRRELMRNENEEWKNRISDNRKKIEQQKKIVHQEKLKQEEFLHRKEKIWKKLLVHFPALIITFITLITFFYFRYIDSTLDIPAELGISKINFGIYFISFVLLIYLIISNYYYFKRIKTPLKEIRKNLIRLDQQQISNLNSLVEITNNKFYTEFEHRIHSLALDDIRKFKDYIQHSISCLEEIESYIDNRISGLNRNIEQVQAHKNVIIENEFVSLELVNHYFKENQNKLNHFFTKGITISSSSEQELKVGGNPFSYYVNDYIANNRKKMDYLENEIDHYCRTIFKTVFQTDLNQVIFRHLKEVDPSAIVNNFQLLLDKSEVWIKLNQSNVNDSSYAFSNLYIEANTELKNNVFHVLEDLSDLSHNVNPGNNNEIIHLQLKVGFPAFSITALYDYHKTFCDLTEKEQDIGKESFYYDPEAADYNIFDEKGLEMNMENDAIKVAVLSVALEILEFDGREAKLENQRFSISALGDYLISQKGRKTFYQLLEKIESIQAQAQENTDYSDKISNILKIAIEKKNFEYYENIITDFIHSISTF